MTRPATWPEGGLQVEMLGDTRIRCGEVEVRHRTPIFALARRLIAEGADPDTQLTVRWAGSGTVSMVEPISKLAALDVVERDDGERRFARYHARPAFSSHPVAPETTPVAPAGVGMPAEAADALVE